MPEFFNKTSRTPISVEKPQTPVLFCRNSPTENRNRPAARSLIAGYLVAG
jgi:hypothetical protein